MIHWPEFLISPVNLRNVWPTFEMMKIDYEIRQSMNDNMNKPEDRKTKCCGPTLPISEETHRDKYRGPGETFKDAMARIAGTLCEGQEHFNQYVHALWDMRFLPAGRIQAAVGSPRMVTAFNCFVAPTIHDSMEGIMGVATKAALTMKTGGGIGYDFSTIRPRGDLIKSIGARSSGVLSFMQIYNTVCATVESAGNRRGAQMGVLRVDHPDIEDFIEAKTNDENFRYFNLSVAITDEFMHCALDNRPFDLVFDGRVYKTINAKALFDKIMRATWDWAEPGVLFIDRINAMNNLYYCEVLAATNPCGEQPLPPNGACLLGSFNLTKYLKLEEDCVPHVPITYFDTAQFRRDIPGVVRAQDNVIDSTMYPLPEQKAEALNKRRMGLGLTGVANAGESMGLVYGSTEFIEWVDSIMRILVNEAYSASAKLAREKGAFPYYDKDKFLQSKYLEVLEEDTLALIREHGLRNSHLISFAPTGTISLCADNVSSGIEPVFAHQTKRTIIKESGPVQESISDWAFREGGVKGRTADECSVRAHLKVLAVASKWSDSAVSKTINVGEDVTWEEFKDVYIRAWELGCKGCTTYRAAGKRYGVLNKVEGKDESTACYIDPTSGRKTCE